MKAKNNSLVPRGTKNIILLIIIILTFAYIANSLSFSDNPTITPLSGSRPDTNDTLTCSWNASGDTTQENVTWYKDGVSFKNETDPAGSQSIIDFRNTSRGQIWNCTVTLTNGTNNINLTTNVTIKNAAPTIPKMTNGTGADIGNLTNVTEDMVNTFTLTSTDPDGDKVTYGSWDTLPTGSNLNSNTGVFTWTPDYDNNDENITFYARDNQTPLANSNKFIMFIVNYVNDEPEINPALTDQAIYEGDVFNYAIIGTDEENNTPLNFSVNVTPSLALVINTTSNTTAIIMFVTNRTATYSEGGNYTVNISITDSLNATNWTTFALDIAQVNIAPILTFIPMQNGTQGLPFTFNVRANDPDVNDTLVFFNITPTDCTMENPWNISTTNNSNNATGLVNVTLLNNTHVVCRNVRIIVIDDNGAEDFQDVFLNISNTNDPPNVEVLSSQSNNTWGNNISSQTGYALSSFVYIVNGTDIDNLTYEGEVLIYGDNSTFFNISNTTGMISFTPSQNDAGNHTINITVSDDSGLIDNEILYLEIVNNSAPVLNTIGDISCVEDSVCYVVINATDSDGDNLSFTSNDTTTFNVADNSSQSPVVSAEVNYTPNQSIVGNHSIVVTVTDSRGAVDNETFLFTINNTNDNPRIPAFTFPTAVEGHSVSVYIKAIDQDYDLSSDYATINVSGTMVSEYVTYNVTNLSGEKLFTLSTFFNSSNNKTYTRIIFTPQTGEAGDYSINITAIDNNSAINWTIKNYTVYNRSLPPNITTIRPYGRPYVNSTVFNFTNRSNYANNITNINFNENRNVLYNLTVTDDTTADENLTYSWFIDGVYNSSGTSLTVFYDYFSSGIDNVTVIVGDDRYENVSWTWNATINNTNRMPRLISALNNISVNATTVFSDYLKKTTGVHFIDPDDDLDSDNDFDVGESSTLTYTATSCAVADLSFSGDSLTVDPESVGVCTVTFTAEDPYGLTNTSANVFINVTDVPNSTEQVPNPQPSTGGGGGQSRSVVVPMTKEEEKPKTIEIIVPELVTIYQNETVLIPVVIQNNWNNTLYGIDLNASSNASDIELVFTEDYFPELIQGERRNVTLMVNNYRLGENYEVRLTANVTNPVASDSALVLLNSIEQSEEGEDVETKVTFAQDLLNENPECMELNELLLKAKEELQIGSREEAAKMVSGVIEGCKYLVSISKRTEQRPETIVTKFIKKENLKYLLIFLGLAFFIIITVTILKKHGAKAHAQKEGKEGESEGKKRGAKPEEEEVKPYWNKE